MAILKMIQKKSTSLGRIMGFRQYTLRLRCELKSLQPACIKFSNFMPILDKSVVTTPTFIISGYNSNLFSKSWNSICLRLYEKCVRRKSSWVRFEQILSAPEHEIYSTHDDIWHQSNTHHRHLRKPRKTQLSSIMNNDPITAFLPSKLFSSFLIAIFIIQVPIKVGMWILEGHWISSGDKVRP